MKVDPFLIIKLFLVLFICIGVGLTIFMAAHDIKFIGAYIFSGIFTLFPSFILYGIIFGFRISEKTIKKKEEKRESLTFDNNGISYQIPLFDTTQFIRWDIIETVIYTNYQSADNAEFIFYLSQPPAQTMSEKPWFLNRIFPFVFRNLKEVMINDNCKNFHEIPKMLQTYLVNTNPIDLSEDYLKGTLLGSKTTVKKNTITKEEHWRPNNNYEREKVIYDKYNRTFAQIKNTK